MDPAPTGVRTMRAGTPHLVLTRRFAAPVEDVWAAVTEPRRLRRWIGTWTGDPASGRVDLTMTAEGEDATPETVRLDVCDPPRRLLVRTRPAGEEEEWLVRLDLAEAGGTTTLTFGQAVHDPEVAAHVGPGWEYYLDRLVAAETGGDVGEVVWDRYFPAQCSAYRALFG